MYHITVVESSIQRSVTQLFMHPPPQKDTNVRKAADIHWVASQNWNTMNCLSNSEDCILSRLLCKDYTIL